MRFGFFQVEQPHKYVRAFDKLALFCKPKGEAILPDDQFRGSDQRLESIIRADNSSSADNLHRDRDDSGENYREAQSLHRPSSPAGVTNHLKQIAEAVPTKVTHHAVFTATRSGEETAH